MDSPEKIASELVAIDLELAKHPDNSVEVLKRVLDIMQAASAIDTSRASFALGLVTEALRPARARQTLLVTKQRLIKALNAKSTPSDSPAPAE